MTSIMRGPRTAKPIARLFALASLAVLTGVSATSTDGRLLATEPVTLTEADILRLERFDPAARQILDQVRLEAITYQSDGLEVRGYLARPREAGVYPCVIYNRGGNRSFGAIGDLEAVLALGSIAGRGYVVVASQYRGHTGTPGRDEFGGADVNDVLNLIPLLDELPGADASRIGMVGWSRGGMMTYLALTRTDRIAAAVVGSGAADLASSARERPELERVFAELIPHYPEAGDRELDARSAVHWPERLHKQTPILVLQGSADWRVDPRQTLVLAEKLYSARHPFRLVFFEGGDHGLSEYRGEVRQLVGDWLARYVRMGERWPSLEPHGG